MVVHKIIIFFARYLIIFFIFFMRYVNHRVLLDKIHNSYLFTPYKKNNIMGWGFFFVENMRFNVENLRISSRLPESEKGWSHSFLRHLSVLGISCKTANVKKQWKYLLDNTDLFLIYTNIRSNSDVVWFCIVDNSMK